MSGNNIGNKGGKVMLFAVIYVALMAVVCTKVTESVDKKLAE